MKIKTSTKSPNMKHYSIEIIEADPKATALVVSEFDAPSNNGACDRARKLIEAMSDLNISASYKVVRHKRVLVKCKKCCEA